MIEPDTVMAEEDFSLLLAKQLAESINRAMRDSERTQWAAGHRIGVSDIGHCREYVRRMIMQEPFTDDGGDVAPAFIGTAFGDLLERMVGEQHENARTQESVTVRLRVGDYELRLPGHPDIVLPNMVIDGKTKDGLAVVRREGPTQQQWFQIHLYAQALIDEGELDPEECWVALAYFDRSGREGVEPHVVARRFDPAVVEEAQEWIGDVFYAVEHGEEASRDKPRDWCYSYCPFATGCRGGTDTDVEGLIEDEEALTAVKVYTEATAAIKEAENAKRSAQGALDHVSGSTGTHTVRWVDIGPSEVSYTRRGYRRLDIRPVRGSKK